MAFFEILALVKIASGFEILPSMWMWTVPNAGSYQLVQIVRILLNLNILEPCSIISQGDRTLRRRTVRWWPTMRLWTVRRNFPKMVDSTDTYINTIDSADLDICNYRCSNTEE